MVPLLYLTHPQRFTAGRSACFSMILRSNFTYLAIFFIFQIWLSGQQSMWAEQREFPLPTYMSVRSLAPSLKVIPDHSAQRPLSAHLKFHSAPVKSLHARSNLKEGAIPDVAPIWAVCLLFGIFHKLHLSTNNLLEGTCESGFVHALDSWSMVSEWNWSETEPSLWPLDQNPLRVPTTFRTLLSIHMPWWSMTHVSMVWQTHNTNLLLLYTEFNESY